MAYMNQERKATLVPGIKAALAKHGLKGRVNVPNRFTIGVVITEGPIDFFSDLQAENDGWDYIDVNTHWIDSHFEGESVEALTDIMRAMSTGNWDNSDIQTDYFDVGWYLSIKIGKRGKPYILKKSG